MTSQLDVQVLLTKLINSICTMLALCCILRLYSMNVRMMRLMRHCRRMVPLNSGPTWPTVLKNPVFWLECVVVAVHLPPYITSEYHTYSFENLIVYRAETMGALANSLRCYLIYRYLRDRYLHSVPKRKTIQAVTDANLGAIYLFKLNTHGWHGAGVIIMLWGFCILMCGYWYRSAEMTACQLPSTVTARCQEHRAQNWLLFGQETKHVNDVYIWDALWLCLITSLTIGYGDVSPMTYYGRLVAVLSVFLGMALGAFLTASIVNILQWTPEEVTILRILERHNFRTLLAKLAADKIRLRVRRYLHLRRLTRSSARHKKVLPLEEGSWKAAARNRVEKTAQKALSVGDAMITEANEMTGRLRRLQFELNQEDHTVISEKFKVDLLHSRTRALMRTVEDIYERLSDPATHSQLIIQLERDKDFLAKHRENLHHFLDLEEEQDDLNVIDHRTMKADHGMLDSFLVRRAVHGGEGGEGQVTEAGGGQNGGHNLQNKGPSGPQLTRGLSMPEKRLLHKVYKLRNEMSGRGPQDSPSAENTNIFTDQGTTFLKYLEEKQAAKRKNRQLIEETLERFQTTLEWRRSKTRIIARMEQARLATGTYLCVILQRAMHLEH